MIVNEKFKKLVMRLRDPARVLNLIPTARQVKFRGKDVVVVNHGLTEVKLLRNIGIKAPAPMQNYYDWPGRFKPFDVQRQTAGFLTLNSRAYVLNGLGSGKTMAALWAFDWLKSMGEAGKLLVVAPLSTLERTWGDEIFMNFPHLNFVILHGTRAKRRQMLEIDADIYIINHDGVKVILDDLVGKKDIDAVVVDELAQVARNHGTARWRALKRLTLARKWVWGMTGTPIPNEPTDAWAQCRLLTPGTVPRHFSHFRQQVMYQITSFKWLPRPHALDHVYSVMQPAIRFSRDECLDLPPVMHEYRFAPLTADQHKMYKEMARDLQTELMGEQVTAMNEAVKLMKLVQIACGAVYGIDGDPVLVPSNHRLHTLDQIIEEAEAKVIVFVPFRSALEAVAEHVAQKHTVGIIHGGIAKRERDEIFHGFTKTKDPAVLVAQPAAMSHGLTLVSANVVVWFAPPNSADIYEQANARITRPGQKHNQFIMHIYGTKVEEQIYDRLRRKVKLQGLLLDMFSKAA